MLADRFRELALELPGAVEGAHRGHPDFRIGTRIFATLGYPDHDWAMVNLDPARQEVLLAAEPAMFHRAAGAWGRNGSTLVRLDRVDEVTARSALAMAAECLGSRRRGRS